MSRTRAVHLKSILTPVCGCIEYLLLTALTWDALKLGQFSAVQNVVTVEC